MVRAGTSSFTSFHQQFSKPLNAVKTHLTSSERGLVFFRQIEADDKHTDQLDHVRSVLIETTPLLDQDGNDKTKFFSLSQEMIQRPTQKCDTHETLAFSIPGIN